MSPRRKHLPHEVPSWVKDGSLYFITLCTTPKGINQLCRPDTAAWLKGTWDHVEKRACWWAHLVLLMPDHLHALLSFSPEPGIKKTITDWKHYTARQKGITWQRDFLEHRLRSDESHIEKAAYIRMNPVRAGLTQRAEDWPYIWSKGW